MKLPGTIQVDLDGFWTVAEHYGFKTDIVPDLFYETSIPRFIKLFDHYGVKATFFVVGKDALVKEKKDMLKELVREGHELANHTMNHVFGLRNLSSEDKLKELEGAEEAIRKISGKLPAGFKAPGYDIDTAMLKILNNKRYVYDSSMTASPFYPAFIYINKLLSTKTMKSQHGAQLSFGLARNRPYRCSADKVWKKGKEDIVEVPCSVMPVLRLPYHSSYSFLGGINYFNLGHMLMKKTRTPLNYSFHAIDLSDDFRSRFSATQNIALKKKKFICNKILHKITKDYSISTTKELVNKMSKRIK